MPQYRVRLSSAESVAAQLTVCVGSCKSVQGSDLGAPSEDFNGATSDEMRKVKSSPEFEDLKFRSCKGKNLKKRVITKSFISIITHFFFVLL
jgi:hypothetical protein